MRCGKIKAVEMWEVPTPRTPGRVSLAASLGSDCIQTVTHLANDSHTIDELWLLTSSVISHSLPDTILCTTGEAQNKVHLKAFLTPALLRHSHLTYFPRKSGKKWHVMWVLDSILSKKLSALMQHSLSLSTLSI